MAKKKASVKPLEERRLMIDKSIELSIVRQCELISVHRSGLYYCPVEESAENLHLMRLMDEQYLHTPFYGIRRMTAWLLKKGHKVNRKRVKRLMELMGWQTIYRKPNTSRPNKAHHIYPYLLNNMKPGF